MNYTNNRFAKKLLLAALIVTGFNPAFSQKPAAKQEAPLVYPTALASDIKVEHVMNVGLQAVRIIQNPVTGDLWYNTFTGDVYRIKNLKGKKPIAEKIFSSEDHAITRLQGMAFAENTLFLGGNVSVNEGKGTKGRMVKYDLSKKKKPQMTEVFNTVEYGTNKTTFDHGWNAIRISPDGKFIYVTTGSRTDHGEVQDNGGAYPNARDNALTAKIFRFPIESENLLLENDEAKLKSKGYIYAEGIRNAFDMEFDADGNLFAVVNSGDADHTEDMFWVREGHHFGFPWIMGGTENPQQNPNWQPNLEIDHYINRFAHAWLVKYFHNDPDFPKRPEGVKFTAGVQNLGPDANEYRGHSGKVLDGDLTGVTTSTFTPHSSPLGLVFDKANALGGDYNGDAFVIRYSNGARSSLMKPFTDEGADLLHLKLSYNKATDNYFVKTMRVVDGFKEASDAVLIGNELYVIEYGGRTGGNLWKITFPR
jgi:glucose/arabinose dehydrogenase